MTSPQRIVVVGGGLAGAKSVEALRELTSDATITLVAAEPHLPYERPPLSKSYLAGQTPFDEAVVHTRDWYADQHIDLRLNTRATAIDAVGHVVRLTDESTLGYDKLILATGSTPRRLAIPGADADGVATLRTRDDADLIASWFGRDKHLAIIGAGWIGLEVAAAARAADTHVTVLESADLPLLRVLGPDVARVFADLHRANDVDLRTATGVAAITTSGERVSGVGLTDGSHIAADHVLIGVGAAPDVSLAESAGIVVDNGVLVDSTLQSSDPDIYAVGDIANHDHPVLGRRVRVEHWATALNQPAAAAASLLGRPTPYTELPYFFTDQYDLGMEYIGHADPSNTRLVIRGNLAKREFIAFWLDADHHIQAAMNVNVWDVPDQIKPLIVAGTAVDPEQLADTGIPLPRA
ncbi:NAD(P)/FAD-dependent oxidoreductase [Microlunatus sp. Gsoil 973]|jgi:NADPH-dependent 2,4-dienoyl-CoA reductase/sulfur reductase-like enzyme|uniref:NAD(P)/FAD-dependent oxidoreductase n=1 Tax=Microlunatus sp. Gsoil 973 TaxID=2672569 RepID=UPI0012B4F632|nr:FAD-dependent oxidoreductase [Microlunatus sp. Gsoil 973]QGN34898.1 NAD(P)/FAD-dependent oxidoreductase [Microlunatus sp. Gsoil 973]